MPERLKIGGRLDSFGTGGGMEKLGFLCKLIFSAVCVVGEPLVVWVVVSSVDGIAFVVEFSGISDELIEGETEVVVL